MKLPKLERSIVSTDEVATKTEGGITMNFSNLSAMTLNNSENNMKKPGLHLRESMKNDKTRLNVVSKGCSELPFGKIKRFSKVYYEG